MLDQIIGSDAPWPIRSLRDLIEEGRIELGRGQIISKPTMRSTPGPYPVYSSSVHNDGRIGAYGRYMFDEELITWSVDGGGHLFYRPRHRFSVTNVSGFLRIRFEDLDYRWLHRLLAFQHSHITFDYQLKAHPSVIKDVYQVFDVDVSEQRRIARVLDTVDVAIRQTEAVIAKLKQVKAGLLHDLLTRGLDENGELRDPVRHPEQFKDSPLGRVPKEWEVVTVADVVERIEQGWSPSCDPEPASQDEWAVLKTSSVTWDGFDPHENKRLPENLRPRPQYEVCQNDVLMTRAGPNSRVGVVAVVHVTRPKMMLSDKLYRLRAKASILPGFLGYALASKASQGHLSRRKTGLAESQTNISQKIVRDMRLVLPPRTDQSRIIVIASEAERKLAIELLRRDKLVSLKQGLMHDLLTGRVRVPEDAVEGVAA